MTDSGPASSVFLEFSIKNKFPRRKCHYNENKWSIFDASASEMIIYLFD